MSIRCTRDHIRAVLRVTGRWAGAAASCIVTGKGWQPSIAWTLRRGRVHRIERSRRMSLDHWQQRSFPRRVRSRI